MHGFITSRHSRHVVRMLCNTRRAAALGSSELQPLKSGTFGPSHTHGPGQCHLASYLGNLDRMLAFAWWNYAEKEDAAKLPDLFPAGLLSFYQACYGRGRDIAQW